MSLWGDIPEPTAAQLLLFTDFTADTIVTQPLVLATADDTFVNTQGMYTVESDAGTEYYYMWLEYELTFLSTGNYNPMGTLNDDGTDITNEPGATWCNHESEQQNETWRLMFQMGDEFSDWEGVKYTNTNCEGICTDCLCVKDDFNDEILEVGIDNKVILERSTISNARLRSSIALYEHEESSF